MKTAFLILLTSLFSPLATSEFYNDMEINILFIGNSFTSENNMPQILQKMLDETNRKFNVSQSTYFGTSLEDQLFKSITKQENGKTFIPLENSNGANSTKSLLSSKLWHYLIVQDFNLPNNLDMGNLNTIEPIKKIQKEFASNLKELLLFKIWPSLTSYPKDYGYTKDVKNLNEECNEINYIFDSIAKATNIKTIPITNCYCDVLKNKKNVHLHDGPYLPSIYGAYLNACVFYKYITKQNASTIKYNSDLDATSTQIIKEVVDKNFEIH